MSRVALGFVETRGNTGAINAIDAMLKTANVEFVKRVEIGGAYVTGNSSRRSRSSSFIY